MVEPKKINRTFLLIALFFTVGFIAFIVLINNWIKSALKEEEPAKVSKALSSITKTNKTPILERIELPTSTADKKLLKKKPQEELTQEPMVEREPEPIARQEFLVN